MSEPIRVDVWSDIACPWCYLGKHRFERGIAAFRERHPDVEVTVESHSYELAPDTPEDFAGGEVDFLVRHKGMPAAQVELMLGQMTELAASEGLDFDFARVQHANTRRAHRVLHLARERGLQAEMLERLFRAYFAQGRRVSDPETLAELGAEVGLDPAEVRAACDDDALGAAVDRDIARARGLGVTGVPFWLIDQQYAVSGAQPDAAVADVLGQVLERRGASGD